MYPKDKQEGATDEWINDAIILEIKDNTPYAQRGYQGSKKIKCEFCGVTHNSRIDTCDIKTELGSGNELELGQKMRLQDLYDMLSTKREIIL